MKNAVDLSREILVKIPENPISVVDSLAYQSVFQFLVLHGFSLVARKYNDKTTSQPLNRVEEGFNQDTNMTL